MHLAVLASSSKSSSGGSALFQLFFFGAIFVAMYFLLLRPQRRRMKETQNLQGSLAVDDEVVLSSGVIRFISAIDGDVLWLDIAEGVEIRVLKSAVARKIDTSREAAGGDPKSDTSK